MSKNKKTKETFRPLVRDYYCFFLFPMTLLVFLKPIFRHSLLSIFLIVTFQHLISASLIIIHFLSKKGLLHRSAVTLRVHSNSHIQRMWPLHFLYGSAYPLKQMLSSLQFTFSFSCLFCFAADLEQSSGYLLVSDFCSYMSSSALSTCFTLNISTQKKYSKRQVQSTRLCSVTAQQ